MSTRPDPAASAFVTRWLAAIAVISAQIGKDCEGRCHDGPDCDDDGCSCTHDGCGCPSDTSLLELACDHLVAACNYQAAYAAELVSWVAVSMLRHALTSRADPAGTARLHDLVMAEVDHASAIDPGGGS